MTIAFTNFKEIEAIKTIEEKHRAWLKDYEGLHFSIAEKGKDMVLWQQEKEKYVYSDKIFDKSFECLDGIYRANPNKIQRHKGRSVIEFDDKLTDGTKDKNKCAENLQKIKEFLKKEDYGHIISTHHGSCDYAWVEFTRDLTETEAKKFLLWIAPEGSEIDMNFTSDNKRFPVLFAQHWKYQKERELPIEYNEGKQIDFDSINFPKTIKVKHKKQVDSNGFEYPTAIKGKKKEIRFDYEVKKPEQEITNLEQLEKVIIKNFPTIWFETRACLSICATLSLKNLNGCPSLNLIGNPSGEKTTVLSFFYGQNMTYISDDFTPRAFVSHSANVEAEKLEEVDLLPRLKNKILITPELAPLFEAPKDKLIDNFAMLTRVLDGEGLNRDSGTHGHRGYSGDYKFAWLGGSTPLRSSVWNIMGKIGNRLFFLNMRDKNRNNADYLEMFRGRAYDEKVKDCRGAIRSFLDSLYEKNGVRKLDWDAEGDIFLLPEIIKYAKLLSKLRGSLMIWKSEEQGKYEFNFPIIEEPPRAINSLYNLAKGHALINGRNFLRSEDLEVVKSVCFSSMPHDRYEFLKLLAKHEGKLTTRQIEAQLGCSDETARKTMNIFKVLGIVEVKSIGDYQGRPMSYVEIKDEFKDILCHTQILNDLDKSKPSQINPVYEEKDG